MAVGKILIEVISGLAARLDDVFGGTKEQRAFVPGLHVASTDVRMATRPASAVVDELSIICPAFSPIRMSSDHPWLDGLCKRFVCRLHRPVDEPAPASD